MKYVYDRTRFLVSIQAIQQDIDLQASQQDMDMECALMQIQFETECLMLAGNLK